MPSTVWRPAFHPEYSSDMFRAVEDRAWALAALNRWMPLNAGPPMHNLAGTTLSILSEWREASEDGRHYLMLVTAEWLAEADTKRTVASIYQLAVHDKSVNTGSD